MVVRPKARATCEPKEAGRLMLEERNIQTFVCSTCKKERRIDGPSERRKVSYIETNDPQSERPICFNCIRRLIKAMSNA
jgi:hypothetical protein